jgi:hypothetical protein
MCHVVDGLENYSTILLRDQGPQPASRGITQQPHPLDLTGIDL